MFKIDNLEPHKNVGLNWKRNLYSALLKIYEYVFCLPLYDYQNIIYRGTFCYKTTLPLKQLKMEVYSKEINNMKIMIIT